VLNSSKETAEWACEILTKQGIDERADWRMLEYWFQVELFHAFQSESVQGWVHYGTYEHPYFTHAPLSGSKSNFKWVDLLCATPSVAAPRQLVWLELKDVGRNPDRVNANVWALGKDLIALYEIDPTETAKAWRNPPDWVKDAGRTEEWSTLADGLEKSKFSVGQIVLAEKNLLYQYGEDRFENRWKDSWHSSVDGHDVNIERSDTEKFAVFSIITMPRRVDKQ
jgi:hypothetical protein